jgi:hypothetical protein
MNMLKDLEKSGAVISLMRGRNREVQLNPHFFAGTELRALLEALALHDSELQARVAEVRRRPRRAGKEL